MTTTTTTVCTVCGEPVNPFTLRVGRHKSCTPTTAARSADDATAQRPSVLDVALALNAAGYSTVPIRPDGSKAPAVPWIKRQLHLPTEAQVRADHEDHPARGLGIVCGAVSGCELLEFEGRVIDRLSDVVDAMHDAELGEVWERIVTGWAERSPSGGMHLRYRIADGDVAPNYRIAQRPATPAELAEHVAQERDRIGRAGWDGDKTRRALAHVETLTVHDVPKVLAETRGEGGYAVAWPSNGTCHPSGGSWDRLAGGPDTIATVTAAERAGLHRVVREVLNETVPRQPRPARGGPPPASSGSSASDRPGDDFNARTSWADVLEPYGWQAGEQTPGGELWTRPGKRPTEGHSAIVNAETDRLKVFSTSVAELPTEGTLDRYAVYAHYEHGGDFRPAASALRAAGYGGTDDDLLVDLGVADPSAGKLDADQEGERADHAPEPATLAEAEAVFRRWLGPDYDLDALRASLAAVAAERLDGDPPWVLVLSGSGNAKTETVMAAEGAAALVTSSVSGQAALLSASPKRDRGAASTGGLLRRLGSRGVLVIKDVTSILSMHREARTEVLAAFREVADGRWTREVGADGGTLHTWQGRIVVLGAVTSAWDNHHAVIATMGDRFLVVRIDSRTGRRAAGRQALANIGHEVRMRTELRAAFGGVIAGMGDAVPDLGDHEVELLLDAADLVTLVRTNVERDQRDGTPMSADQPEAPTRFLKQLGQILRGGVAVGMSRDDALRLALRLAHDSMPPARCEVLRYLSARGPASVTAVRRGIGTSYKSAERALRELHLLGVVEFIEDTLSDEPRRADGRFPTNGIYRVGEAFQAAAEAVTRR
ncbi:hypothetical protein GCM10009809_38290 [Isoptericola hypogeus]|uniref:DNA primase/polymerase bifunctional N-terminal domain-containing protein n=1 Tax=Isoptericola hypogeus TaxID=300179 RepID=A0ABP4VY66_9MICO